MSRDLTPEELATLSKEMKQRGFLSYEEFCEELAKGTFCIRINCTNTSLQLHNECDKIVPVKS